MYNQEKPDIQSGYSMKQKCNQDHLKAFFEISRYDLATNLHVEIEDLLKRFDICLSKSIEFFTNPILVRNLIKINQLFHIHLELQHLFNLLFSQINKKSYKRGQPRFIEYNSDNVDLTTRSKKINIGEMIDNLKKENTIFTDIYDHHRIELVKIDSLVTKYTDYPNIRNILGKNCKIQFLDQPATSLFGGNNKYYYKYLKYKNKYINLKNK